MCRKLETEEEKVLPFYSSSLSPEEDEQVASVEAEPALETLAQVGQVVSSPGPYLSTLKNTLLLLERVHQYYALTIGQFTI